MMNFVKSKQINELKILSNVYNIQSLIFQCLTITLLHSERPKLYTILAFLSAIGLT